MTTAMTLGSLSHYDIPTLAVDLDGTLLEDRYPDLGEPVATMQEQVNRWKVAGYGVVIYTARPHTQHGAISRHLISRGVLFDQIVCGGKPSADLFIDDRGFLPPAHALDAMAAIRMDVRQNPRSTSWIQALGEDRLDCAWAREQWSVPENPNAPEVSHDDRFRIVIPLSGGMDSTTLWHMAAVDGGEPVELVYVDGGQPYADTEKYAASRIIDRPLWVVHPDIDFNPVHGHIIPGRNAAIVMAVAKFMYRRGWWGEIWLGNLSGESPPVGGDKSSRFMLTMQQILTLSGYDVNLVSPLRGMDKPDLVNYWSTRGLLDKLRQTKSCFHPHLLRCGKCQSCFRTLVAWVAAGEDWHGLFPDDDLSGMEPFVQKYVQAMPVSLDAKDGRYTPRRVRDTLGVVWKLQHEGGYWNSLPAEFGADL